MNKEKNRMPGDHPNGLEEGLKGALRRQPAPDGFADRVLARLSEQNLSQKSLRQKPASHESWLKFFTQPLVRWAALAAIATAMILGVHLYNLRRERAQGEAAKQRLMLALRIAGSKLQLAKTRVNEINAGQRAKREEKE